MKKKSLFCISTLLAAVILLAGLSAPVQAAKSYSNKKTTKSNPAVVLYIQYSSGGYSDAYAASRDISICPVKEKPGYRIYDIIIYPDRINLYSFPNMTDWDSFAAFYTQKYGDYEKRTAATEQAAWKAFRDKYLMKSYKVKSGTYEAPNPDKNSSKRLKAYKKIFRAIKKKTPSKHIVVKYQGHGNMLPVFCQSLSVSHTKKVLKEAVKTFGCKLALVDYGTNCYTLTPALCEMYAPYVDYILGNAGEWSLASGDGVTTADLKAACKTKKQKKLYKKTFLKHFSTQELGVAWPAWSAFPFL